MPNVDQLIIHDTEPGVPTRESGPQRFWWKVKRNGEFLFGSLEGHEDKDYCEMMGTKAVAGGEYDSAKDNIVYTYKATEGDD